MYAGPQRAGLGHSKHAVQRALSDWLRRPFWTWCSAFFFLSCSLTRAKSSRSTAQLAFSRSLASANSSRSPSLRSEVGL